MTSPLNFIANDQNLDQLARRLDTEGIVCVEGAVPPESLQRWRDQLDQLIEKQGFRYFSIIQPWKERGSAYEELAADANLRALLTGLTTRGCSNHKAEGDIFNVLRVIAGPNGKQKSFMFHYDASVVTMLIPLQIPEGKPEDAGDLIAWPNRRPIRGSSVANAFDKLLIQNPLSRWWWSRRITGRPDDRNIHRLTPGNIYLFWGYRTLHANLGCKSNTLRATLLFHHGDPHQGSLVTRAIRWTRRVREARNVTKMPA